MKIQKNNVFILISLLCFLSSCVEINSSIDVINSNNPSDQKRLVLQQNYVYDHLQNEEDGEFVAAPLFDSSYIGSGFNISLPKDLIAGDVIIIDYYGEIYAKEIYPPVMDLYDGEVISYSFLYTDIIGLHVDDGYISRSMLDEYRLLDDNVIIDEKGHFVPLDDFKGENIFLSLSYKDMFYQNGDQAIHDEKVIAGLYGFNPR